MTQSDPVGGGPSATEQLRHDIDDTRAQLGQTVERLARKADVKARVQDTLDERRNAVADQLHDAMVAARDIRDHFRNRRG
jgi:hypothetical protein